MTHKIYIELIFLIFLGIVSSLSLPPFNFFILNFFTFSLFFFFLIKKSNEHNSKKLFFFYGWLFGFGFFAISLYWISISLTFDENFKFLIPFTLFLIPTFLAIFYGLVSYFFILFKPKNIINSFFIFSLIFGIIEFIRGMILTGFPWNLIIYSFSKQLEILSITSIIGTYGLNLLCISLFTSPVIILLSEKKKDLVVGVAFIILFIIFFIFGLSYKDSFEGSAKKNYDYKIRVIGSNISLDKYNLKKNSTLIIEDLIKISGSNIDEKIIFIWPEAIIPDIYQDKLNEYKWLFNEDFNENHLFIIGTKSHLEINGSKEYFNSLSIYDNNLNLLNSYNKINLVPFGEFLPSENILKSFGLRSLTNNYQSFSKGNERKIIEIKESNFSLKILPLICYEIIYSGKLFKNPDFDLIINISEDGWFGQSIGPKQHFDHSILRAIESGKYVLRSSNNGVAGIINPIGIIEQKINHGQSGYIDLKEIRKIQPTIFSKYGNKVFVLLIFLYIFLIFSFNKIKNE